MKKKFKKWGLVILSIVLLLGGAGGYILWQNDFDMSLRPVVIESPQGKLAGTLALPDSYSGKLGLVLFIHGDGPVDSTHNDGYKPLWEKLASAGYASLSLNKRGIGGSEGNWLHQSMDDRVTEARQALAWAGKQPMIDRDNIGVWGASQAGWVIPKLAGVEPLAFSILVSPAINWLSQGEYHTRKQMEQDGHTQEEIAKQAAYEDGIKDLLKAGASYEEYVQAAGGSGKVMDKDRWLFVSKNFASDAAGDLKNFNSPVLLLLGDHDVNVDVNETEKVYREGVRPPELLRVKIFPDTEHSMLATATAESPVRALLISLFAPRDITVKGYMEEIVNFLSH
ncbi:alpha/beta hydrolase [Paenibacillus sp. PK3_47]|uniref:alpha/beta hydrolase family protein n=1 Tax=Paenibacillus sp. PK3_47 TaxID=2072642 RepID=UPI00201D3C3D|nr:prolyl oligopeptidase family serine peptidase [Paenibacillus sp. PK3_47]UQZ37329.1 alpha/beta hydrolase [Paenibacillus sp. PK3_47]